MLGKKKKEIDSSSLLSLDVIEYIKNEIDSNGGDEVFFAASYNDDKSLITRVEAFAMGVMTKLYQSYLM